jgi:carbon storage regulator
MGEAIVINDHVWVRVVDVRGNRVRLAISAPESIPVHREEIHRKRSEFQFAAEALVQAAGEPG